MSREEYLQELWGRLSNRMPRQELENVMHYYEEYFEEAGSEREQDVIAELGSPAALAAQIMGEAPPQAEPVAPGGYPRPRRRWTTGQVVLAACLFPIWLPLLIAVFAVAVCLVAAMFAAVVGIAAGGIGAVVAGIFSIWCGFTQIFHNPATTIFFSGGGLLAAGVGLLLFLGGVALGKACSKATAAMFRPLFRRNQKGEAWT